MMAQQPGRGASTRMLKGNYPVEVQCAQGDKKGSVSAQLQVN